jgi:rare lipoprotein A
VIRPAARWPVALSAALLGACSSLPAPRPVPPAVPAPAAVPAPPAAVPKPPADLASIPDAVPRVEPRSRYGNPVSYVVFGQRYQLLSTAEGHVERGTASWYGPGFHAARTSSGEPYDMYAMTAAHKTLPIPAYARVTNLRNGRSVVVRINDRGPFVGDRIIDLSYTAAWKLDMLRTGTAPVEVRVLSPGADVPPVMVASVPVPSAAVAAGTGVGAAAPSRTMLQAGAFFDAANARSLVARLAAAGIGNATLRPTRAGARTVWQVRVGPLDSGLEVDDMLERLRLAGLPDARRALD